MHIAHDQRARLHDAVNHARVEREVVDAERLVQVRERRGEAGGEPVIVRDGD
jgi:hypothetical protein